MKSKLLPGILLVGASVCFWPLSNTEVKVTKCNNPSHFSIYDDNGYDNLGFDKDGHIRVASNLRITSNTPLPS